MAVSTRAKVAKSKRNYRKEYDNYHSKPEQRQARSSRVQARRKMAKAGLVQKGDGKDVHHTTGNPLNNSRLSVQPRSVNRSVARTKTARKKNPRG